MKNAFLTEMPFYGKVDPSHPNMRVEFAWMVMSDAIHYNISNYNDVKNYDQVFVIIPKGKFGLNIEGTKISDVQNPFSNLLSEPFITELKNNNGKVYVIQEGPSWITNDLSVTDQFNWYSNVYSSDGLLCHNKKDISFFEGLFPNLPVTNIQSWMVIRNQHKPNTQNSNKVLIGGNFSRWYGGFQSYIVATEFDLQMEVMTSHSTRDDENLIENLSHIPRLDWSNWISKISEFKWAVHLMPTVAAGTFSMNMSLYGIPTIGNKNMDTQYILFPDLSVDVDDISSARLLAQRLKSDSGFDRHCREYSMNQVHKFISDGSPHPFFMNGIVFEKE